MADAALRIGPAPEPNENPGAVAVFDYDGRVVATGHLVVDMLPDATATDKVGASVRFVGNSTPSGGQA